MKRILLSVLLVLAPLRILRAGTSYPVALDSASGASIQLSTPLGAPPLFGFMPLRVLVANNSDHDGTWQFRFKAGSRTGFPGEVASTVEVTVKPGQNRDTWVYVPLAEPGVLFNRGAPAAPSPNSAPTAPPRIAGLYPSPAGTKATFRITRTVTSGATIERTFLITETGPAALLPNVPEIALPARTTVTVSEPAANGEVRRVITMTVTVVQNIGVSSLGVATTPTDPIVDGARQKLLLAGLLGVRGTSASSSARTAASNTAGMSVVTVTFRQTGPAESLTMPPANQLPAGFEVELAPGPMAGTTMRSFIFKENIATATLTAAAARASSSRGGITSTVMVPNTTALEADARAKLANSRLLTLPAGATQAVEFTPITFLGPISGPVLVALFVQTGPASALPKPSPASLPDGVVVNLHPGPSAGSVTRTVSYIDPATITAASGMSSVATSIATAMPLNLARLELARYGYLRVQPGVQLSGVMRSSTGIISTFAGTATASPSSGVITPSGASTMIVTETGPTRLLPVPPLSALPPGTTVNVTAGALPGESIRNFVVPVAGGAATSMISSATMVARAASTISVEIAGPGLAKPLGISLSDPLGSGTASTPALAVSVGIETPLRGKLVTMRGAPNLVPVELTDLPDDWRFWAPYHGVILKASEYAALEPPRRAGLRGWVAQGGLLFLLPEKADDEPVPPEHVGAGVIRTLIAPLDDLLASDLGEQLQLDNPAQSLPPAGTLNRFEGHTSFAAFLTDPGASNTWLVVFTLIFAALVGPVNFFLLARGPRRYRVFITTPLIALGGALALGAAIVAQDGIGGDGVRTSVVVLLPGDNAAVVYQDQIARTGLLGSTKFPLKDTTVLTGVPMADYDTTGRPSVLVRTGGEADGDWFRNRWRSAQHLRRIDTTRSRVEWQGVTANGAPMVVSTVSTTLRDFIYVDEAGGLWTAAELPPGQSVTLKLAATDVWTNWVGSHFSGSKYLEGVLSAAAPREARRWMAVGGDTDLAPIATLASIKWTNSTVIYTGLAAGAGQPANR